MRKSSGKFKSWELGREHEEADARQSVKNVNKNMPILETVEAITLVTLVVEMWASPTEFTLQVPNFHHSEAESS